MTKRLLAALALSAIMGGCKKDDSDKLNTYEVKIIHLEAMRQGRALTSDEDAELSELRQRVAKIKADQLGK